jgi:hypothetical protein
VALQRLGFIDKPSVGDHVNLYKLVLDHPEGPVTLHTGLDMGQCSKRDVSRIRRESLLRGDLWSRALKRDLPRDEYDQLLRSTPKRELVLPWWRDLVSPQQPAGPEAAPTKRKPGKRKARRRSRR